MLKRPKFVSLCFAVATFTLIFVGIFTGLVFGPVEELEPTHQVVAYE